MENNIEVSQKKIKIEVSYDTKILPLDKYQRKWKH